jgi:hypothetical protein
MIVDQQPDPRIEFPLRRFKELLRWTIPQLHEGTDICFRYGVWKDVWKLPGHSAAVEVMTEGNGQEETFTYDSALVMTSSTNMVRVASRGRDTDSGPSFERKGGGGRTGTAEPFLGRTNGRKSGPV